MTDRPAGRQYLDARHDLPDVGGTSLPRRGRVPQRKNWNLIALQTEEENPDGADAYAIDLQDSSDLLFANTYIYRVSRNIRSSPAPSRRGAREHQRCRT